MIDIEKTILNKSPEFMKKPGGKALMKFLKKISHEQDINNFIAQNRHLRGFSFLNKALDHFNFSYNVDKRSINQIPAEGRAILVANHPIGSLDGLALLSFIRTIRADVRIVANELLDNVEPLKPLFLPVDNLSAKTSHRVTFKAMLAALENEEAVIIFPAGEVSRIRPSGVRDGKWKSGFLKLAEKTGAPVVPIYIDARNSALFYGLSTLYKPLGTLMLAQEMFNKHDQTIAFHVGAPIPWQSFETSRFNFKQIAQLLRKHIYRLDKPKKAAKKLPFAVETTVAHPADRKAIKKALKSGERLGETSDGKLIYLFDYEADSPVMEEIGRLRELTFRSVKEGTGTSSDLDYYDASYRHLVLWDDEDLEIVGAYRIGECKSIVEQEGISGLYTSTLFNLKPEMQSYFPYMLEMGRSFVQPKYWGKRSLDYLWYGIGAYVAKHPETKYLFGPVSLSDAYPARAKALIVAFYQRIFGSNQDLAIGMRPYQPDADTLTLAEQHFNPDDYKGSFKELNRLLENEGVKVPTLFKQYAELCEPGGCRFIDFSVDPAFNDCIDSLILVEIDQIKEKKKNRYIHSEISSKAKAQAKTQAQHA